jgi:hypothetical protein
MVAADEIVVDRLGDMDAAQRIAELLRASSATMRTVSEESLPPI